MRPSYLDLPKEVVAPSAASAGSPVAGGYDNTQSAILQHVELRNEAIRAKGEAESRIAAAEQAATDAIGAQRTAEMALADLRSTAEAKESELTLTVGQLRDHLAKVQRDLSDAESANDALEKDLASTKSELGAAQKALADATKETDNDGADKPKGKK